MTYWEGRTIEEKLTICPAQNHTFTLKQRTAGINQIDILEMSETKNIIENKLEWIESLDSSPITHSNNIIQFNQEVKLLIKIGDEVVEPLIERLYKSNNRYMQWAASWVLREIGDDRALDAFWYALKKYEANDIGLQRNFILGICMLKDKRISDNLIEIIKQKDNSLVSTAIRGLGILRDKRAVTHIVDLFMNGTQEDYSIIIPGGKSKVPGIHVKKCIIETLGKIRTEEAISELNRILYLDPSSFIESLHFDRLKCDVIVALAMSKKPSAITAISEALKHPGKGVRKMAKRQLALWNGMSI